jgi:hypothetical protein
MDNLSKTISNLVKGIQSNFNDYQQGIKQAQTNQAAPSKWLVSELSRAYNSFSQNSPQAKSIQLQSLQSKIPSFSTPKTAPAPFQIQSIQDKFNQWQTPKTPDTTAVTQAFVDQHKVLPPAAHSSIQQKYNDYLRGPTIPKNPVTFGSIAKSIYEGLIYDPITKTLFPNNLYNQVSKLPKPKTIADITDPNSEYNRASLNLQSNLGLQMMGGVEEVGAKPLASRVIRGGEVTTKKLEPLMLEAGSPTFEEFFNTWKEKLTPKQQAAWSDPKINPASLSSVQDEIYQEYIKKYGQGVKPQTGIITDKAAVQEIKNSIADGQNILRAGTFNGKKLTTDELFNVRKSVESDLAKIGESKLTKPSYQVQDVTPAGYGPGTKVLTPEQQVAVKKLPNLLYSTKPSAGPRLLIHDSIPPEVDPNQFINDLVKTSKGSDVKNKVGILDYLKTPTNVLKRIGLGNEATMLQKAHEKYTFDLKDELTTINDWRRQVPTPESSRKIFNWLDGKKLEPLNPTELKVATEIKSYLGEWADKLNLPKDKRVTEYVTHLFEKDLINKEFDPDLAKIIAEKTPSSVYDPFLQSRKIGIVGYKQDVWSALDAYVKRGTRKFNMDPALKKLSEAADLEPLDNQKFIKAYADRINLRPTDIDNLIDNTIKQSPIGYRFGQRPTTALTQGGRQMIYRATLGLNVNTALKNLSQGINTYSELGEKWTLKGYKDLIVKGTKELVDNGVLQDSFVEDKQLGVYKNLLQKIDDKLYYLFEGAEKINRGSTYFAAKAKALSEGKTESEAIEYAKQIVAKTQFKFSSIDTPLALSSDLAKTFLQFQSYGLKQLEFLGGKIKNKEWAGLIRYVGASLVAYFAIGKALGWEPQDMIVPFSSTLFPRDDRATTAPLFQLPVEIQRAIANTPDTYGNDRDFGTKMKDIIRVALKYLPAYAQGKKTVDGLTAILKGYVETDKGKVKFAVKPSLENFFRAVLFGPSTLDAGQTYYDKKQKPLSDANSQLVKDSGPQTYDVIRQTQELQTAQKENNTYTQQPSIIDRLLNRQPAQSADQPTGNVLLDTLKSSEKTKQKEAFIKDVFSTRNSTDEITAALKTQGISYEEGFTVIVKGLGIENGDRGLVIMDLLKNTPKEEQTNTLVKLIQDEVITTGVLKKWYEDGKITADQYYSMNDMLKQINASKTPGTAKKLTKPSISMRKISVPKFTGSTTSKSTKTKSQGYQSIKVKSFSPLKQVETKIK